jgi:hypothetical protein
VCARAVAASNDPRLGRANAIPRPDLKQRMSGIDHFQALKRGNLDEPRNMAWQTTEAAGEHRSGVEQFFEPPLLKHFTLGLRVIIHSRHAALSRTVHCPTNCQIPSRLVEK